MDDRTVGLVLRALRRRRGWRQIDLAVRAGCSQAVVSQVERGQLARSTLATLRRVFERYLQSIRAPDERARGEELLREAAGERLAPFARLIAPQLAAVLGTG